MQHIFVKGDFAGGAVARKAFRVWVTGRVTPETAAVSELIFGELSTNALRYGEDVIEACYRIKDGKLEISTLESGPCFDLAARLRKPPTDCGGRGLTIVAALADTLHVDSPRPETCRVTATLHTK